MKKLFEAAKSYWFQAVLEVYNEDSKKKEIEFLENNNCKIVTLGNRILRTETVAMAMASVILYELADFGGV